MQRLILITLLAICFCTNVLASVVFRCLDPINNVTTFSDLPCQHALSTKVNIPAANQIRGITHYERSLINKLDADNSIKKQHNSISKPAGRTKHGLETHCIRNQLRIDKINLKLKQGYKSNQYNEYHSKLRLYKKYRSQYCAQEEYNR